MPVRVHDPKEVIQKVDLIRWGEFRDKGFKMLGSECLHEVRHCRALFLLNPLLLEGLEEKFKELCHQSEAGSFVEEIKFFIILFRLCHGILSCCLGFLVWHNEFFFPGYLFLFHVEIILGLVLGRLLVLLHVVLRGFFVCKQSVVVDGFRSGGHFLRSIFHFLI